MGKFKYTKEQILEGAKKSVLPDGWMPFLTSKPSTSAIPTGDYANCLTLNVEAMALANITNATSGVRPIMRDGCFLPIDNPDVPGHSAPSFAWGMAARFLDAAFAEGTTLGGTKLIHQPKWVKGKLIFMGHEVDPSDEEKFRQEALRTVGDAAIGFLENPAELAKLGNLLYWGKVGFRKKGDAFKKVLSYAAELPSGEKAVDLSSLKSGGADKASTSSGRPARGKKKVKKKTRK